MSAESLNAGVVDPHADLWFTITTPGALGTTDMTIRLVGLAQGDDIAGPWLALYSGTCGALSEIMYNVENTGNSVEISTAAHSTSTTYYLRVGRVDTGTDGAFRLTITL